jgi:branched-chain amino acid aminotransferase
MSTNIKITRTTKSRLPEVDFNYLPFGKVFTDHMFIADYIGGQWVNPRIEPFGPVYMHPASMVLHYSQTIFEGMKAGRNYDGQPMLFRLDKHVERINASARRMCMPEIPGDLFKDAIRTQVALEADWIPSMEDSSLYIRPFMYATDEFIGVRPSETYRFVIFTCPTGPYYDKPVRLLAETSYIRAAQGGTGEAKTGGNYAASLLPATLAVQQGFDQVMWLEGPEFKNVQESGTMNIFFVIDGKLITPGTDGTILRGITRDSIIQLMRAKGYSVEERRITIDEIVAAHKAGKLQECFGAGTAAVVSHVSEISYQGELMTLPGIETREIGNLIKAEINGLRNGIVKDEFGWVEAVEVGKLQLA